MKTLTTMATFCRPTLLFAILVSLTLHNRAFANVLAMFPSGIGCKSAAMETAGDCNEPQTLAYNPAIMQKIAPGFAGELGVARLNYGYEHPDFDPVRVRLYTPMFSEGWKGSFLDNSLSLGFAVVPSSVADLKIKGLPRRVSGTVTSLNIRAVRRQFHMPVGGSYFFKDLGLSLGGSLMYTYDYRTLKGATVSNPDSNLVDMTGSGHFVRPILGSYWTNDMLAVGASYMFPLTKKLKGTTTLASEAEPFSTEQVDYDPAVLLTHGRVNWDEWSVSANINHVFGNKGKSIQRDGLNRKTTQGDLKDANHVGGRVAYRTSAVGEFSVGASYVDSYWGAGYFYNDSDGIPHHEVGHLFGQFNAVPVRNQAVSWRDQFGAWNTSVAIYRSAGSTTVGPGGDNPGLYQLEFVSVSAGLHREL